MCLGCIRLLCDDGASCKVADKVDLRPTRVSESPEDYREQRFFEVDYGSGIPVCLRHQVRALQGIHNKGSKFRTIGASAKFMRIDCRSQAVRHAFFDLQLDGIIKQLAATASTHRRR